MNKVNRETVFRFFILGFTAVFAAFFLVNFFYFKIYFSWVLALSAAGFFAWIFFEAYIRVQHNIDGIEKKFQNMHSFINYEVNEIESAIKINGTNAKLENDKLSAQIETLANKNADSFFIIKNDIEFRLLLLKAELEKMESEMMENIKPEIFKGTSSIIEYIKSSSAEELTAIKENQNAVVVNNSSLLSLLRMSEISFIEQRKNSLLRVAQDIFNFKTVLYIGAHKERSQILEEFLKNNYKITLLEVFKPNVDYWKSSGLIDEVVEGDVRTFDSDKKFDVVFWWHGPEHIKEGELLPTLSRIEEIAEKMVVLGCPWGECDQGVSYGNEFETHHTIFNEGYFEKLGYKTDYLGRRDLRLSNICAVKYVAKKLENISYAGANTERV